jgi:glycosyltransferase involved in cell wall biosynthesis
MKILIIHQYFNTPESGGPLRSYYLANGLVSHGHEVEIITAHNRKSALLEEINGFKVHYLPVFYDNRLGFTKRVLAFVKFAWLAYRKARSLENIDLCYAISTPLTTAWVAQKLKSRLNLPYIFEVGDLWPEAPVQMGAIRWSWIINRLRKFEKSTYQNADQLVALSPGIKDGIIETCPDKSVAIIPNMSDCQFYHLQSKDPELESRFGVHGKLVVTYFGAAGKANHLEYLIDGAYYAKNNRHLHFLIMAQGSELNRLKELAARYELDNLDFLPYRNRIALKEVLNINDVVYVSYADKPVLATGSPNKYFDGLAAGKLMMINFKGWLKDITEQHEIGYYVDPEKPQMLSEVLTPLVFDKRLLLKSQQNARLIAETFFSRELAIQKLLKTVAPDKPRTLREPEVYNLTA